MSHALLERPSEAAAPDPGLPPDVPFDAGGPERPDYGYLKTMAAPDTSHAVADAYGMREELGLEPMDDVQLRPGEDGLVRGDDGRLYSVAAETRRPRVASVFDLLPQQRRGEHDRFDEPTGQQVERPAASPRHITVRDQSVGATALHVAVRRQGSQHAAGKIYQGKPVNAPGTLYGGRLVGENSYRGMHRPR